MTKGRPLASIGLPVRNGETFLAEALDSLRAQTLGDFELIVSDNASTDRTAEIAREAESADPRIRYVRQETNIGAAENFNFVFTESRGQYFCWASHDDRWAAEFLERCVGVLDADPEAVLSFTGWIEIDAHGREVGRLGSRPNVGSELVHIRFGDVLRQTVHPIFGLIRSDVLGRTALMRPHIGSDRALLAELALRGTLRELPEALFFSRHHADRYSQARFDRHQRQRWWSPEGVDRFVHLPNWTRLVDYARAIRRVPLTASERRRCWIELVADGGRRWRTLVYDLGAATRDAVVSRS